MRKNVNE
jgi:hypothetical protein